MNWRRIWPGEVTTLPQPGERLAPAAQELRISGTQVTEVQVDLAKRDGPRNLWNQVMASGR